MTRWVPSLPEEVVAAPVIHARLTWDSEGTLCEADGGRRLPSPVTALVLDVAKARPETVTRPVTCPECLEWMHA